MYQPLRDFEAMPEAAVRREPAARGGASSRSWSELGAGLLLVCSNVSPDAIDDDALAAAQLHALAERAAAHGIRIAYEALAWGRHVRDYDHAWRIAEAGDHPNLGTCLDSFHILSRGGDPAGIRDIPAEKIFFLQLADAPELVMDVLQWSRHYRCFPGQGGFDLAGFLEHVLAAGYDGPLSLEVFNDVFRQADPERMAVDAMRSLLLLEEATAAARRRALHGYAFAELAVAPEAAASLERLLIAMGFRHAGQHRTKAVQLWRHGDTRILVNHEPPAADRPRVAAIAVESADPIGSAQRAEALLAPVLPRDRGPGEADLTAIAAPDGTSVFFCRTDAADADSWVADFVTAGRPAGAGTELTGIDHVALSQPFDYFDEAALFYRSVLGLELEDRAELAAPDGLVRSRAARSADGSVRFALSVPVVGRGGRRSSTSRSPATTSSPRRARCATAACRCSRSPATTTTTSPPAPRSSRRAIERMRELGVLYDGGDGGELLHFYTAMAGSSCSSRCSSGAAATRATARPTRRSGWPRSAAPLHEHVVERGAQADRERAGEHRGSPRLETSTRGG